MATETKLDSINACLDGIGIAPVDSEDETDLDAATASRVIDRISRKIQAKGWWFNKEHNWKLTPDPITGFIPAPSSAISIVPTGVSRNMGLVIRGDKIYDTYNHTFNLTDRASSYGGSVDYIEFVFITELPYDLLPPTMKYTVTYIARREFAQDMEVDERRWKFQKLDEEMARDDLLREDARNKKRNALTDNSIISNFLSNVGGTNSGLASLQVFPQRNTY